MTLRELEKTLRGTIVASIQWRDEAGDVKEILTHIHLIKYCNNWLLDSEVLRIDIGLYTIEIFVRMNFNASKLG